MRLERFNDKAHVILQDMLDYAEERIVRKGLCTPDNAVEYLALDYIKTCGDFIEHGAGSISKTTKGLARTCS